MMPDYKEVGMHHIEQIAKNPGVEGVIYPGLTIMVEVERGVKLGMIDELNKRAYINPDFVSIGVGLNQ